ncbi:hypothetical protein D5018_19855 [Parashewanella curva]|uniref:DUF6429 domain-containing protein n=1 Tax=Parashewanella curva TaxID=2338552 RepID=A0A3L8PRV1_9GAMM|nr:DUF6429 family protein [Parashewanella curva]RLV57954.1 hypothetical protein D5018_19855 [Parashewanella curva]
MEIDENKIDEAALALLYLTLHDDVRAWKQINWDITDRLYEKGLIYDPVGKNKSVVFTDDGLEKAKMLFEQMFTKK